MDEQRLYPLVLWSPTTPGLPFQAPVEIAPPPCTAAPGPAAAAPSAQPTGPFAVTLSNSPCPTCPAIGQWLELRTQAGYWKNLFERCKQCEQELRQQLAQLQEKNWQRLFEQAQLRAAALERQVTFLLPPA